MFNAKSSYERMRRDAGKDLQKGGKDALKQSESPKVKKTALNGDLVGK